MRRGLRESLHSILSYKPGPRNRYRATDQLGSSHLRELSGIRGRHAFPCPCCCDSWRLCLEALSFESPGEDLVVQEQKRLFFWLVMRGELHFLSGALLLQ